MPTELTITFRRKMSRPIPSKFFEIQRIGGPRRRIIYIYIGTTLLKIEVIR